MKRFLLFAGENYYPLGGWTDFRDDFDTLEEARAAKNYRHDLQSAEWFQIVDTEQKMVVEE